MREALAIVNPEDFDGLPEEKRATLDHWYDSFMEGILQSEALLLAARTIVQNIHEISTLPTVGTVSLLEKSIHLIAAAGLVREVEEELVNIAEDAPLPCDRATALQALATLDDPHFENFLVERLQRDTSTLVLTLLVGLAGEKYLRSTEFLVRDLKSRHPNDILLREECQSTLEALQRL